MPEALLLAPLKSKTGFVMSNGAVEVGRSRVVVLAEEMMVLVEEMVVLVEKTVVLEEETVALVAIGMKGGADGSESDISSRSVLLFED